MFTIDDCFLWERLTYELFSLSWTQCFAACKASAELSVSSAKICEKPPIHNPFTILVIEFFRETELKLINNPSFLSDNFK